MEPTQRCPTCGEHKTREHFSPSRWGKMGRPCKACYADRQKRRRHRQKAEAARSTTSAEG
jgi:hypothetical protein